MEQNQVAVFLSLGSNQGDTLANLTAARHRINAIQGLSCVQASRIYFTEPQDLKEQPWFANQVVALEARPVLSPGLLLAYLQQIESDLGRSREVRFGPRTIDLDILLFGNQVSTAPELILPHPRMGQRAFVLVPLLELAPDLILPGGQKAGELLSALHYKVVGDKIWQA